MEGEREPRRDLGRADLVVTVVGVLAALAVTLGVRQCLVWGRVEQRIELMTAGWPVAAEDRVRMGRSLERELRPLFSSPRFDRFVHDQVAARRASGRFDDEASFSKSLGSALEAKGRPRLADADLAIYQALKRRLVHASERACACHWDPAPCSPADVMDGLARLSDDELATWYRISAQAALAELAAEGPVPSTQASLEAGNQAIIDRLSPPDRERFLAVWEGRSSDRGEQCFAIRALFDGLQSLDPALRARYTRALANLGNKEP
jgi:hypothetical protein